MLAGGTTPILQWRGFDSAPMTLAALINVLFGDSSEEVMSLEEYEQIKEGSYAADWLAVKGGSGHAYEEERLLNSL